MGHAMMETLQQLGLTSSSTGSSSDSSSSDSSSDSSTSATGNIRSDMAAFMNQLFQAMRSETTGTDASTSTSGTNATSGTSSATGSGPLADALSALTTAVANGSAPAGLQSAFNQLMQDFQSGSSASNGSGTSTSTSTDASSGAASPSLQNFLTTLQQNLAHHGQHNMAVGNVISTQA